MQSSSDQDAGNIPTEKTEPNSNQNACEVEPSKTPSPSAAPTQIDLIAVSLMGSLTERQQVLCGEIKEAHNALDSEVLARFEIALKVQEFLGEAKHNRRDAKRMLAALIDESTTAVSHYSLVARAYTREQVEVLEDRCELKTLQWRHLVALSRVRDTHARKRLENLFVSDGLSVPELEKQASAIKARLRKEPSAVAKEAVQAIQELLTQPAREPQGPPSIEDLADNLIKACDACRRLSTEFRAHLAAGDELGDADEIERLNQFLTRLSTELLKVRELLPAFTPQPMEGNGEDQSSVGAPSNL